MQYQAADFLTLLEPHYNSAVQYCRALYAEQSDAEDGLQDAIVTAMQQFGTLRDRDKFRSWLFTIITRNFYRSRKEKSRRSRLFQTLRDQVCDFPEVYDEHRLDEKERLLFSCLTALGEKERSALLLFEIGGFSMEEIRSMQRENSLSAIKSRISRARVKLRDAVEKMEKAHQKNGGYYDI